MRVAYICADSGIPVFGCKGASVHVQEILRAMLRRGADIDLFAARVGESPPPDLAAVRVHSLPATRSGSAESREQSALAANSSLRESLAATGAYDLVYERYSLWSFAGMEFAREVGIPALLEVNAPLIEEQSHHRTLIDRESAVMVAQRAMTSATGLITVSEAVANYVKRFDVSATRVHVVANGVDPDRFATTRSEMTSVDQDEFTIGFLGTLKKWHGLPILLQAFETVFRSDPGCRLLIVGDGPERQALDAELCRKSEDLRQAISFSGAVAPAAVPRMLGSMDLAVAPYPPTDDFYFSPLKVYEYMAAGLPVVVSQVGRLNQLIEHGVNGMLYPPGNAAALADTIADLRQDPARRQRLGQAARRTVQENHTWDAVLQRILHHTLSVDLPEPACPESRV